MTDSFITGPHGVRSGWRLLTFLFLAVIPFLAIDVLVASREENLSHPITPSLMIADQAFAFLCPLFAAWVMSRLEHKGLGDYGLPGRGAFGRRFWAGGAIGLLALTVLLIAIRLGGGFYFGHPALGARGIFYFGILWAVAFILVALAEEFLFRGYALATLAEGIGFWPAAILLSVAFGAIHLPKTGEDLVGALGAATVGLLFCFSLRRSGSLWFAIGLHASWDYGESFIYSVPDSATMVRGHLLNSSFAPGAPVWLTGGSVGPEASVFVFVVLGLLFLLVDRMFPEVKFPRPAPADQPSAPGESNPALN